MNNHSKHHSVAALFVASTTALLLARAACILLFLTASARADEPAQAAAQPSNTYKVVKGPLHIEVSLDGVFDARDKQEISLRPQSWSELVVREAAAQGAAVKSGDVILKLDSTKLEEAIKDLEATQKVSDLTLRQEEADFDLLQQTSPLDMQAAQRAGQAADEDLRHFLESDREMRTRSAEFSLKHSKEHLEYVTEELKQLEKMYKADDLYEETEEIILKRQRAEVETARFGLEGAQAARNQTLKTTLPRQEANLRDAARRAAIALEKLKLSAPVGITKASLELEKLRSDRARSAEKLDKLRHDLALMTVRAARPGVVYYGVLKNGQLATAATVGPKLERGGAVTANEVLMTIVGADTLDVHATAPEATLHQLRVGFKGRVTPTGFPNLRIPATVQLVPAYPDPSGKFSIVLALDAARLAAVERRPVPGMTCKVQLAAYSKADAITIPVQALQSVDAADAASYVLVEGPDGKAVRRDVQIGQSTAERLEITAGLQEGDTVLLHRPDKK